MNRELLWALENHWLENFTERAVKLRDQFIGHATRIESQRKESQKNNSPEKLHEIALLLSHVRWKIETRKKVPFSYWVFVFFQSTRHWDIFQCESIRNQWKQRYSFALLDQILSCQALFSTHPTGFVHQYKRPGFASMGICICQENTDEKR